MGRIVGKYIIDEYKLKDINEHDFGAIVSSACLAHDIGNPPFGHAGEGAISDFFRTTGSYIKDKLKTINNYGDIDKRWNDFVNVEGNALGFHTITKKHYRGFDLTLTTLAAFTKYPRESKINNKNNVRVSQKKYGFFFADREIFKGIADELGLRSLNENKEDYTWCRHPLAFLTEAADDICYRLIDFEDGVRTGWIDFKKAEKLLNEISGINLKDKSYKELFSNNERLGYLRSKAIFNIIYDVADEFIKNEKDILSGDFDEALIKKSKYHGTLIKIEGEVKKKVYKSTSVLELEATGFEVLGGLLHYFIGSGDSKKTEKLSPESFHWQKINELLPEQFKSTKNENNLYNDILKIIDYVAGMSDSYAIKVYRKLKGIEIG